MKSRQTFINESALAAGRALPPGGKYHFPLEFMPGLYVCRALIDDHSVYAGVCWSKRKSDNQRTSDSGFVNILEDDKVVSNPGGIEPTT